MSSFFHRGDIWIADLGPGIGSEQKGRRPVLILQNNVGNRFSPTVVVAAITSRTGKKRQFSLHCTVGETTGLSHSSVVLLEQLRTIDKKRLIKYVGPLKLNSMQRVDRALAMSIGLIQVDWRNECCIPADSAE